MLSDGNFRLVVVLRLPTDAGGIIGVTNDGYETV